MKTMSFCPLSSAGTKGSYYYSEVKYCEANHLKRLSMIAFLYLNGFALRNQMVLM